MKPTFFRDGPDFRRWLEKHHQTAGELWVGFYRKESGRRGITYAEALDEALSFGWIDGLKKRVDGSAYTYRFSRRRRGSAWSAINVKRARELARLGRMRPPGLEAFERRDPAKSGPSADRPPRLAPALERRFRAKGKAWASFQAWPPGRRRVVTFWVMSAKRDDTKARRLARLIEWADKGLPQL
ncbi:MAG: YdeI/OmpD-associated family protein [Gemmatimonadetes bacterium]|nr:YdeI/OmpD-associated family protein [Gemmatimonadota bacterium]